jgi:probable phosphoglycerate mutase
MTIHECSTERTEQARDVAVLHLVRHGESAWNVEGRVQGQSALAAGLTETGREQARQTGEWLAEHASGADLIVSSDLLRTRQTAEIIADEVGLPVEFDPGLREQWLGQLEGELRAQELNRFWTDPFLRPPGGETVAEMYERVRRVLSRLATRRVGLDTVLVTHGGPIGTVLATDPPTPGAALPRARVRNASVATITVSTGETVGTAGTVAAQGPVP